ncbi:MAG: hypothetical protein PHW10_00710 [Candidatus Peribacteraceae bacterium]|nr:hypothetical protein [Candidatus Peribacteraceae bacterium]
MKHTLASALFLLCLCGLPNAAEARVSRRVIRREAIQERLEAGQRAPYLRTASYARLYDNDAFGFTLRFPSEWTAEELGETQGAITTVVLFLSPLEGEGDASRENINLVTEDVPPSVTAGDYAEAAIAQQRRLFDGFTLLHSRPLSFGGLPGHGIAFEAAFGGKRLIFEQAWIQRHGTMYVWTLAAPATTIDRYSLVFHDLLSTFTFNG